MSSNNNNNTNNNNDYHRKPPDYGRSYAPNAGPANLAPQTLDHFKRGYQERTAQRHREVYRPDDNHQARQSPSMNERRDGHSVVNGVDMAAMATQLSQILNSPSQFQADLDQLSAQHAELFVSGRAQTALLTVAARRRHLRLGRALWEWMQSRTNELPLTTFHYNSMIAVCTHGAFDQAMQVLDEMTTRKISKNQVTFSNSISACEKAGKWQDALQLLDRMKEEGFRPTAIAFNAAISACEKGLRPDQAMTVFERMKHEGIRPSVVTYSALISASEKGGMWKLALQLLEDMKREGPAYEGNVVAYSAAISSLAKGQRWQLALRLFREIESYGRTPSIVTFNATMTALEKSMEWERALHLFEQMKMRNLPITVVSYGSALSACDKGFQYRQALEYLDEMTEMGIGKNVIIFGAALSCMEKCSRADISLALMDSMKEEGVEPNVHIYNSLISACARNNMWEKGYELYQEMERVGVERDVVTYNAVLDAVYSQIELGRELFNVGVQKGFYAKVSRIGGSWFELDLHFLSLGAGEIAFGWWFEECLTPWLQDREKLEAIKSISIVTGYGKTRTRGRRHGDDGMRKRCKAMIRYLHLKEVDQENAGRIHIDKDSVVAEVKKNGGKLAFDLPGYVSWKEAETTANAIPETEQKIRARFRPKIPKSGKPPFVRVEMEYMTDEYRLENLQELPEDPLYANMHDDDEYNSRKDYAKRDNIRYDVGDGGRGGRGPRERNQDFGGGFGRGRPPPGGRGRGHPYNERSAEPYGGRGAGNQRESFGDQGVERGYYGPSSNNGNRQAGRGHPGRSNDRFHNRDNQRVRQFENSQGRGGHGYDVRPNQRPQGGRGDWGTGRQNEGTRGGYTDRQQQQYQNYRPGNDGGWAGRTNSNRRPSDAGGRINEDRKRFREEQHTPARNNPERRGYPTGHHEQRRRYS